MCRLWQTSWHIHLISAGTQSPCLLPVVCGSLDCQKHYPGRHQLIGAEGNSIALEGLTCNAWRVLLICVNRFMLSWWLQVSWFLSGTRPSGITFGLDCYYSIIYHILCNIKAALLRLLYSIDVGVGIFALFLFPESKVHWANMGPIWGRQGPGGPHVGPMNFAIWVGLVFSMR